MATTFRLRPSDTTTTHPLSTDPGHQLLRLQPSSTKTLLYGGLTSLKTTRTKQQNEDHKNWPPSCDSLLAAATEALTWKPADRTPPIFTFAMTQEAAQANFATLKNANFDLAKLTSDHKHSQLRPGSEFRPVRLLRPILEGHPHWHQLKQTLTSGATFPLEPIDEQDRQILLRTGADYGNHNSATTNATALLALLAREVEKGWHLPLPLESAQEIPGLIIGPMGLVEQNTFEETGKPLKKFRLTHDQSFDYGLEGIKSVNDRTIGSELSASVYGFALRRLLHTIIALRTTHPSCQILLTKFDFKSAYRRIHFSAETARQSTVTTVGLEETPIALLALRATFGGSACPFIFSELSESVADLSNSLAKCTIWDPSKLRPTHAELLRTPVTLPNSLPFTAARELLVKPGTDS
jgi:hypothetical protein